MLYTTIENIQRRLRGRLSVQQQNLIPTATANEVDTELIQQITNQIEAKINLALSQVYLLPIPKNAIAAKKILESIVEKLIVSEIATVHFQQSQSSELGGDAGFGAVLRKQAVEELEAILHGHGIFIPGITSAPPTNATEGMIRQPLVLPDVQLIPERDRADTFIRSYSYVVQTSKPEIEEIDFGYPSKKRFF